MRLSAGLVALAVLVMPPSLGAQEGGRFEAGFMDATMRVDYYHWGNAESETIAVDRMVKEGRWAGSRKNLTNSPDNGKYRFRVLDAKTRQSLYEQGYSTLFGEWQTTDEAKAVNRAFHETVRFPFPLKPVILQISSRNNKGKLTSVFEQKLDPESHLVVQAVQRKDVEIVTVRDSGVPGKTLDVVILADGYSRRQMEKARRDLKRYGDIFVNTPPFDKYKDRISIRGVLPQCDYSGPDEPRKGIAAGPAVGTAFNTFDSPRYLTTLDNRAMRDLAGQVPYDTIYIMVNSSRYGGAGIYNFFSIFVTDNEYDEYVFIHEFGHGFGGLADEYYTSSVAYSEFYPRGVEPPEPNITALLDGPDNVKWKELLDEGIPVPTPNDEAYAGKVGVFEGAGYSAKGLYRPAFDCKMKSKRQLDFCPVCMKAVKDAIKFHTE